MLYQDRAKSLQPAGTRAQPLQGLYQRKSRLSWLDRDIRLHPQAHICHSLFNSGRGRKGDRRRVAEALHQPRPDPDGIAQPGQDPDRKNFACAEGMPRPLPTQTGRRQSSEYRLHRRPRLLPASSVTWCTSRPPNREIGCLCWHRRGMHRRYRPNADRTQTISRVTQTDSRQRRPDADRIMNYADKAPTRTGPGQIKAFDAAAACLPYRTSEFCMDALS